MIPIVDGHNDALLRVWRSRGSLRERSDEGHLDLPRMREGGVAAGFFAVFVPATDEEPADPRSRVHFRDDGWEVPLEAPLPYERATRVAGELVAIAERDLRIVTRVEDVLGGDGGRVALTGPGPELLEDPRVAALHLGGAPT